MISIETAHIFLFLWPGFHYFLKCLALFTNIFGHKTWKPLVVFMKLEKKVKTWRALVVFMKWKNEINWNHTGGTAGPSGLRSGLRSALRASLRPPLRPSGPAAPPRVVSIYFIFSFHETTKTCRNLWFQFIWFSSFVKPAKVVKPL